MSRFVVRPAEVRDAGGIAHVHVTSWLETYRGLMPDSVLDNLSVERRTKQLEHTLEDGSDIYHLTLVAEANHKVVGFANYGKEREGDPEYQGELFAIYILKEFHEEGIGREMVKHVASGLLAIDISSMLVWVLEDNLSKRFYERLGGEYLREKQVQTGDSILQEKAYGWRDIHVLI